MPVVSPCIGVCTVDADGVCEGCLRTLDEIRRWPTASDHDRMRILNTIRARAMPPELTLESIHAHLDSLCKPPGSLGEIERLAVELCRIQNTLAPSVRPRRAIVFAADHGVAIRGVSAWSSDVTSKVVAVMASGRSASGVLAQSCATEYRVVDVGCLHRPDLSQEANASAVSRFVSHPVAHGTADLSVGPAMTRAQFNAAWRVGLDQADEARDDHIKVIAAGEMGIGNTTSAACLVVVLANIAIESAVGRGAGVDDQGFLIKQRIVGEAAQRARSWLEKEDWKGVACEIGGFEIVAMAGLYVRAAQHRLTIVLDGFIATAAALLAEKLAPGTAKSMIASHRSSESGHLGSLQSLGLSPFLDWDLRLGEATGALLLMPMLDAAAAIVTQMAKLNDVAN